MNKEKEREDLFGERGKRVTEGVGWGWGWGWGLREMEGHAKKE